MATRKTTRKTAARKPARRRAAPKVTRRRRAPMRGTAKLSAKSVGELMTQGLLTAAGIGLGYYVMGKVSGDAKKKFLFGGVAAIASTMILPAKMRPIALGMVGGVGLAAMKEFKILPPSFAGATGMGRLGDRESIARAVQAEARRARGMLGASDVLNGRSEVLNGMNGREQVAYPGALV